MKAATTVGAGGRNITNINQAIMYIGVKEMQRLAVSAEILDRFSRFRVEVDWQEFWLHSILVARLSPKIASSFKEVRGHEYLAGLLHDVGKLVLQNYFRGKSEEVIDNVAETKRPDHAVEAEVIGLDHAQIGAAVASAMGVHPRLLNGIMFHHRPICDESIKSPMAENGFIAACVGLANAVAKICESGFQCNEEMPPLEEMDEWHYFNNFDAIAPLEYRGGGTTRSRGARSQGAARGMGERQKADVRSAPQPVCLLCPKPQPIAGFEWGEHIPLADSLPLLLKRFTALYKGVLRRTGIEGSFFVACVRAIHLPQIQP